MINIYDPKNRDAQNKDASLKPEQENRDAQNKDASLEPEQEPVILANNQRVRYAIHSVPEHNIIKAVVTSSDASAIKVVPDVNTEQGTVASGFLVGGYSVRRSALPGGRESEAPLVVVSAELTYGNDGVTRTISQTFGVEDPFEGVHEFTFGEPELTPAPPTAEELQERASHPAEFPVSKNRR
jgi:hypothetical protein